MRKSREKACKLLARAAPLSLACAGALACYSMDPPAQPPQQNLLAEPAPGSPASSVDPTMIAPSSLTKGAPEEEHKKMVFDDGQAKTMLARAAGNAHTCVEVVSKDQPHGTATVLVTFAGAGKSTSASIAAPFDNTPIGQCATRAFIGIIVSPFDGPDVEMTYEVNLNPDPKKPGDKGKKDAPTKKK
ncbi:MAG TPA: hypothetical protein VK540_10700 [Polyangiaceae bacterium]|nr:hypothetical protein [Polyangiaceae bacterium]